MKDLFPGYFREDERKIKEIWDNCYFVFDANILLNLYRYSDATRNEFLKVLEKIKERIWLPYRSAEEYFNNRLSVIDTQEKSYDETIKSIKSLENDLENARQHPFVNIDIMKRVKKVFEELCKELSNNKTVHTNRIGNDEIQMAIASLFNKNTGNPYTKEQLEQVLKIGEERYKEKIPPGFKDGSKHTDSDIFNQRCKKYGDLILWLQLIDKSKEIERPMILVTDDRKEDWWTIFNGKTLGPHPELIKEFKEKTNNSFYMYQADRFLEMARENLNEDVSEEIVNEIREVRRRDKIAYKKDFEMQYVLKKSEYFNNLMKESEMIRHHIIQQSNEKEDLERRFVALGEEREQLQKYRESIMNDSNRFVEMDSISKHFYSVCEEYDRVKNELNMQNSRFEELNHKLRSLEKEVSHRMNEFNISNDNILKKYDR